MMNSRRLIAKITSSSPDVQGSAQNRMLSFLALGGACETSQNETAQHQPFRISRWAAKGSTGGGAIASAVSGWVMSITTALTTAFVKVFGRRPRDAESLPQAQPAGVRK